MQIGQNDTAIYHLYGFKAAIAVAKRAIVYADERFGVVVKTTIEVAKHTAI